MSLKKISEGPGTQEQQHRGDKGRGRARVLDEGRRRREAAAAAAKQRAEEGERRRREGARMRQREAVQERAWLAHQAAQVAVLVCV